MKGPIEGTQRPLALEAEGREQDRSTRSKPTDQRIQVVYEHWVATFGRNHTKLTSDRRKYIAARLGDGYSADDLQRAIDGCHASEWHTENGQTELVTILRDASKVDAHIARTRAPSRRTQQRTRPTGPAMAPSRETYSTDTRGVFDP